MVGVTVVHDGGTLSDLRLRTMCLQPAATPLTRSRTWNVSSPCFRPAHVFQVSVPACSAIAAAVDATAWLLVGVPVTGMLVNLVHSLYSTFNPPDVSLSPWSCVAGELPPPR
jgi:hypothetical protein